MVKLFLRILCFCTVDAFMLLVMTVFPYYVAFVYRYAQIARSNVYLRWVLEKKYNVKFLNMFFKHAGNLEPIYRVNYFKNYGILEFNVNDNKSTTLYIRLFKKINIKDYNDCKLSIGRITMLLSYYFWYCFVWIWLDDDWNINGLDIRVFDRTSLLHKRMGIEKTIKLTKNTKVYESVFSKEVADSKMQLIPFHKRLLFSSRQYVTNWLRDKCSSRVNLGRYRSNGYFYINKYKRFMLHILKYNILERRMQL